MFTTSLWDYYPSRNLSLGIITPHEIWVYLHDAGVDRHTFLPLAATFVIQVIMNFQNSVRTVLKTYRPRFEYLPRLKLIRKYDFVMF